MKQSIFLLTIILSYLLCVKSNVVLYKYGPNSHITHSNNGKIIRETIQSAYFAYKYHNNIRLPINTQQIEFPKSTLLIGSNLHKDYIVRNLSIKLGSIQYNSTESHIFHYIFNLVVSFNKNFELLITHNGENIKESIHNRPISIYEFIEFSPGYHILEVFISSKRGACSCPSSGNGYINTRYFVGWIEPLESKQKELYSMERIMNELKCTTGMSCVLSSVCNRNYPNTLSI